MPVIAVHGDILTHGPAGISSGQSFCTIGGKKVLVNGDKTAPHMNHGAPSILGTGFLTVAGKKVILKGDVAGCGATMTGVTQTYATSD